jgi:RNA polymerase-interacting CarD/CdnL/TRCF family regulator
MEPEEMLIQQLGGPTWCPGGTFGAGRVTLTVPEDGHWYYVVDVAETRTHVQVSTVRIQRLRPLVPSSLVRALFLWLSGPSPA